MYPPTVAARTPDLPAYVMAATGEQLTFAELDADSNRLAHLLRGHGVVPGDTLVLLLPNGLAWPVAVAAGMRTGLRVTPVNWHLGTPELAALLVEAAPRAVVTTVALSATLHAALADVPAGPAVVLTVDGTAPDGRSQDLGAALRDQPTHPVDDELLGARVLFSGGTTGRPKAFRQPLLGVHPLDAPARHPALAERLGIGPGIRFLSPAPSYHAAPFTFQLMTLAAGGTVVCMEAFDPEQALHALVDHEVTHSQWVPTMLSRLLAVPGREDLPLAPSHRVAVTSGAPCPVRLKDAVNDWWGDILHEYYGASEGYGHTYVSPAESRARPGTVGRPLGEARVAVVDDAGSPLPPGEIGRVAFAQPGTGELRGMGDLGRLDADGFLHLTGRSTFMIISGGVNIYPEEIEEALLDDEEVADVAVFGVPHPDLGEQVMAVVELADGHAPDDATADRLAAHCRAHLARFKTPRVFEFVPRLPRLPTGKLDKTALRSTYASRTTTPTPDPIPTEESR
ncbi:AMP-binding protein [Nocardioides zeae]|uniref:AMP-binding protein n=1 Tax=Nocardioides zeae TaxID=1457234 RepID=A0A6P0HMC2_9ACTN|nr:AMP-binding protein [Nocardioides zeae]NEN79832.1 AMP-binding protein [Nocardioides zeae]